jgi:hypothetical protein
VETVIAVTVILSSAAILRAAVLSWTQTGHGDDQDVAGEEVEAEESALSGSRFGVATLIAPPVALLAVALGIGLVPHLDQQAVTAAVGFSDRSSYAAAVLGGKTTPVAVPAATTASTGATLTDLLEAAGVVVIGAVLLARRRRLLQLRAATGRAVLWLRHLHTGHVGDQLTWPAGGCRRPDRPREPGPQVAGRRTGGERWRACNHQAHRVLPTQQPVVTPPLLEPLLWAAPKRSSPGAVNDRLRRLCSCGYSLQRFGLLTSEPAKSRRTFH